MAINLTQSVLEFLCVHKVGNSLNNEELHLSAAPMKIADEHIKGIILSYFTSAFKNHQYFQLYHQEELAQNTMYDCANIMFSDETQFFAQTLVLAEHLYAKSTHPRVKGGEFYVAKLSNCFVDDEIVEAIGLFKSESKETFLKVYQAGEGYEIDCEEGINIQKLDKGCIIFNTEVEAGYKLCLVDNKSEEARYWREDFIGAKPREDNFYYTENYMKMCKNFFNDQLKEDFKTERIDEVEFMNKSAKFFEERKIFDEQTFKEEVIQQPEIFDLFDEYKEKYQLDNEAKLSDGFDISAPAVKNNKRIFKSVIKLDKNFHIYVHGNRELIERGVDPVSGMNYYRLLFKTEV